MKTILITGGAGFIGSHLCERLLRDGNSVVSLDDYSTGRRENIQHLLGNENFCVVEHDVVEPFPKRLCDGVDIIINLACPASPKHYQLDPIRTIKTSVCGTLNVLEAGKQSNAIVLQASTSEVYGDPCEHPQKENYRGYVNAVGPRACYDESKRCAETLCFEYHAQKNVRTKIVRIFNTYGPRMSQDDGRVVSNFIVSALRGEELRINGDGKITRSFQYIDDLVDGIIKMLSTPDSFTGPVNIGNPHELTIRDLAEEIISLTGSTSKITFGNSVTDDPQRRCPDISFAKATLGWEPRITLKDGLKMTIDYYKQQLKI